MAKDSQGEYPARKRSAIMSNQDYISEREEHSETKRELEKLTEQLKKCEEALGFYADVDSWHNNNELEIDSVILEDDLNEVSFTYTDHNDYTDIHGGKRAREYFKNKDKMSNSDKKEVSE